jgi:hypothetical protein
VPSPRAFLRATRFYWSTPASPIAAAGVALHILQWARSRPFWLDEEMLALNLRDRGFHELPGALWLGQTAPLGWLALQRTVLLVFGSSERALRTVPLCFGIATILTAWWIGRRWLDPIAASLLVFLCSVGPWLVYHNLEMKPYSADAFWGLLLPALTAWAAEDPNQGRDDRSRRVVVWWIVAAIGQWFAYGALLVTPACALVLLAVFARRGGWRGAIAVARPGLAWLAVFGLNYFLTLRYTSSSAYLHDVWAGEMPPAGAGAADTIRWVFGQLQPLAMKPGGASDPVLFWLAAAAGLALLIRFHPPLGVALTLVPLSAFLLGALRMVPLYERLTLWAFPALYVGLATLAHAAVRFGRTAHTEKRWTMWAPSIVCGLVAIAIGADISRNGWSELDVPRRKRGNHDLDDRTAVRWLIAQRRPGDIVVTTHLGLPALWWYGNLPVPDPADRRGPAHGAEILEVSHVPAGPGCDPNALLDAVATHPRVLVHLGFRFDDVPRHFDDLLMDRLSTIGSVIDYRSFTGRSRAGIVDLTRPADRPQRPASRSAPLDDAFVRYVGCIAVKPAARW